MAAKVDRRTLVVGAMAAGGAVGFASGAAGGHEARPTAMPSPPPCPVTGPVRSVRDDGAAGDGRQDDTAAVQRAYDTVAERGGVLYFPSGTYKIALQMRSRAVALVGAGAMATTLVPANPDLPVLRATFADARWELATVRDLALDGRDASARRGFVFGDDDAGVARIYVGRVLFERVAFRGFDRAIVRPAGNIGVQVSQCVFEHVGIAIECRSYRAPRQEMHAGTMLVDRSHFSSFRQAALLVENSVSGGQLTVLDSVFENGPGFVLFVPRFNGAGAQPGITLRRTWIENVATGSNIVVDGRTYQTAKCIMASACSAPIRVDDTPIGNVELSESTILTENCALDALKEASLDAGSQLVHRDARQFSGVAPGRCASILGPTQPVGLRTPWFRMAPPLRSRIVARERLLIGAPLDGRLEVAGQTVQVATINADRPSGADLPNSFDVTLRAHAQVFHRQMTPIRNGQFLLTLYVYRLVEGPPPTLQVNGSRGLSGAAPLSAPAWEMVANVSRCVDTDATSEGLLLTGGAGDCKLRVAAAALMTFDTMAEAVAFANAGVMPIV